MWYEVCIFICRICRGKETRRARSKRSVKVGNENRSDLQQVPFIFATFLQNESFQLRCNPRSPGYNGGRCLSALFPLRSLSLVTLVTFVSGRRIGPRGFDEGSEGAPVESLPLAPPGSAGKGRRTAG